MPKDRSPWMEFHASLPNHKKVWALADLLKVDRVTALGHISCLWLWALEQAQDGDLSEFPDEAIAHAAGWKKKARHFLTSLATVGFIDLVEGGEGGYQIHDWALYTGPLMEKRRKDRERKSAGVPSDTPSETPAEVPLETPAGVARHSQQSTVNSQQSTLSTTTTARERYFRAFGHEGTADQISSLENYMATHPGECVEWVFHEIAGSQRPGYGLARFLFNECAPGIGVKPHGPREKPKRAPKGGTHTAETNAPHTPDEFAGFGKVAHA